jgi:hypothetical protein
MQPGESNFLKMESVKNRIKYDPCRHAHAARRIKNIYKKIGRKLHKNYVNKLPLETRICSPVNKILKNKDKNYIKGDITRPLQTRTCRQENIN